MERKKGTIMKIKECILSLLLAVCLVAGLMPTAAFAAGEDTGKAIQLVDSGTAANIGGGQADSIYFGTYMQSSDGNGGYKVDPIKWRVLSNADEKLFLLSDQNIDVFQYHKELENVTWGTSTMRSWLNGYAASSNAGGDSGINYTANNFLDTAFSAKEQTAIADTTLVNGDTPNYSTYETSDKVFLLSIDEASNTSYFPDGDSSRIATNTAYVAGGGETGTNGMRNVDEADYWWLRSPSDSDHRAAAVKDDGFVLSSGIGVSGTLTAVRPAFNLNLNSVLFTSAAEKGKPEGFNAVSDYSGTDWKLTLLDSERNFKVKESVQGTTITAKNGGTVTLNYAEATFEATDDYISAMIIDGNDVLYYGRLKKVDDMPRGDVDITIPSDLAAGSYTLNVFREQYNGDYKTDYASAFNSVSLTVDNTAPELTAGEVSRTSDTEATVKFTSSEAGTYYYKVVEKGAAEPIIDTTGTGTTCISGENKIDLTTLSGTGAKDIYIVVKDAAGNESSPLKIEIPNYVPPAEIITKTEINKDFTDDDIPQELKNAGYDTVAKIDSRLKTVITQQLNSNIEGTALYDVILMYSEDGGTTWIKADKTHFPKSGKLLVSLPVPEGTDVKTHDYIVSHMFTSSAFGKVPGNTEQPEVTERTGNDGKQYIDFYVTGLSPVMVVWEETAQITPTDPTDEPTDEPTAPSEETTQEPPAEAVPTPEEPTQEPAASTGDDSDMLPWVLLASTALMIGAGMLVSRRKINS